jgi:hypothetical protein
MITDPRRRKYKRRIQVENPRGLEKGGEMPTEKKRKKKKNIEERVYEAGKENVFSNFRRGLKKAEKQYKDIPSGMKKDPKTDTEIKLKLLKGSKKPAFKEFKDTRREVLATQRMAKGGRASYNSGGAIKVRDINKDGKKEGWEVARAKGMAKGMGKKISFRSGGAVLKGKKVGCQIK